LAGSGVSAQPDIIGDGESYEYVFNPTTGQQQLVKYGLWITDGYNNNLKRYQRLLPTLAPGKKLKVLVWDILRSGDLDTPIEASNGEMMKYMDKLYDGQQYYFKKTASWLHEMGTELIVRLNSAPLAYWALFSNSRYVIFAPERVDDYALFVATSIVKLKQFKINIAYIELVNEEDGIWSTYMNPLTYRRLALATRRKLDELGCKEVEVIGPGLTVFHGSSSYGSIADDDVLKTWDAVPKGDEKEYMMNELPLVIDGKTMVWNNFTRHASDSRLALYTIEGYLSTLAEDKDAWRAIGAYSTHGWDDVVMDSFKGSASYPSDGHLTAYDGHFTKFKQVIDLAAEAQGGFGNSRERPIIISEAGTNRVNKNDGSKWEHPAGEKKAGCYPNNSNAMYPDSAGNSVESGLQLFGHYMIFMNQNVSSFNYWEAADRYEFHSYFQRDPSKKTLPNQIRNNCFGLWGRADDPKMFLAVTKLLLDTMPEDATVITPMAISASASARKDVIVTVVGDRTSDNVVVYVLNDDTKTRKAKITIQGMTEVHLHKVFGFGGDNDIRSYYEEAMHENIEQFEVSYFGEQRPVDALMTINMPPMSIRAIVLTTSPGAGNSKMWVKVFTNLALIAGIVVLTGLGYFHKREFRYLPQSAESSLDLMIFLSALHLVCYFLFNNTGSIIWDRFCTWGVMQSASLVFLIGFKMAVNDDQRVAGPLAKGLLAGKGELGDDAESTPLKGFDDVELLDSSYQGAGGGLSFGGGGGVSGSGSWDTPGSGVKEAEQHQWWFTHTFVRYYPTYLLSVLIGSAVVKSAELHALQLPLVSVMAQAVIPFFMPNEVMPNSWLIGTILICIATYTAFRELIRSLQNAREENIAITALWLMTGITALLIFGYDAHIFDPAWSKVQAFFKEFGLFYLPAFVLGPLLARKLPALMDYIPYFQVTTLLSPVVMLPMYFMITLDDPMYTNVDRGYWFTWINHGLFIPLVAVIAVAAVNNTFVPSHMVKFLFPRLGDLAICLLITCYPSFHSARYFYKEAPSMGDRALIIAFSALFAYNTVWSWSRPLADLLVTWLNNRAAAANSSEQTPMMLDEDKTERAMSGGASHVPKGLKAREGEQNELGGLRTIMMIGLYYSLMAFFPAAFVWRQMYGSDWYGMTDVHGLAGVIITTLKWLIFLCMPNTILNLIGQLVWPAWYVRPVASIAEQLESGHNIKLYFRIVTRGNHPNLVLDNVEAVGETLMSCLPREYWELEVATDNELNLEKRTKVPVIQLLVPTNYHTTTFAKFKARALQYAIENSTARSEDWIIHLDEETMVTPDAVPHILHHCLREHQLCLEGQQRYGKIGQGGILYGAGEVENWITTLADSLRVADDYGKFRVQFEMNECWVGMHGSFVVAQNAVEQLTTFDHGAEGSITEDAYFALVAREMGVRYAWIDTHMYEQSPFTVMDFIKQRRRWFGGLWLCCITPKVSLKYRITLWTMTVAWALQPYAFLGMVVSWSISSEASATWRLCSNLVAGFWYWCYFLGFSKTFRLEDGVGRYIVLLLMQLCLLPLFAAMECYAVGWAVWDPPVDGFHVVQKESAAKQAENAKANAAAAAKEAAVPTGTVAASASKGYGGFDAVKPVGEMNL